MSLHTLIHRASLPCPDVSQAQAAQLLQAHYGLQGTLQPLGSQQDLNFRVDTPHGRFVLKVCHGDYAQQELEAQHAALEHLHRQGVPVPAVRRANGGEPLLALTIDGQPVRARVLTYIEGQTLAHHISTFFVSFASHDTYAVLMGVYSAILGFFIPSGGGKWIIEAPYVMQVANDLEYHLGWAVQIYNAAEALPNLINPFYMLPLLGVLGLKARDLIGFSFVQLLVHTPLVLFLLWALGTTLAYVAPVMP